MEWKSIEGYEGKYQISNEGKVRSLWRFKPSGRGKYVKKENCIRELKCCDSDGYKIVTLMKDGKRDRRYVHRLVAEAFLPNPENKPNVNHIDYDTSNNNVENLEWCTQRENVLHSVKNFPKRKKSKTNSGEKYIHKTVNNTFTVRIGNPQKTFKTIEEAKFHRDYLLTENEGIFSILCDDMNHCIVCGRPYPHKHHVMNKFHKKKSEKYGLMVPLCMLHHTGEAGVHTRPELMLAMRQMAQKKFEEIYGHDLWMKEFEKNYL